MAIRYRTPQRDFEIKKRRTTMYGAKLTEALLFASQ